MTLFQKKNLFVTMDVSFFKHNPYFHDHLQGERGKEDSVAGSLFHDGFFQQSLNFFQKDSDFFQTEDGPIFFFPKRIRLKEIRGSPKQIRLKQIKGKI